MNTVEQLLSKRQDIWRGRQRPQRMAIPTGCNVLDQHLPDQGWPCGRLIALYANPIGSGELQLLLPTLAEQTQRAFPVMLISPPWVPCPQTLHQAGVCLEHCLIIHGRNHGLWATEQVLRSGLCGAVVLWLGPKNITDSTIRRLQLACENGPAPLFIIQTANKHSMLIRSAIKLLIEPGPKIRLIHSEQGIAKIAFSLSESI